MRLKTLHGEMEMYRRQRTNQLTLDDFILPFNGKLNAENQWVKLSELMPWDEIEEEYLKSFKKKSNKGQKSIDSRVAFGALYIQMKYSFTDEDTTQQICDNPYFQYFLGYKEFTLTPPFDTSMMTYFRKRIDKDFILKITESVFASKNKNDNNKGSGDLKDEKDENDNEDKKPEKKGILMLDATCAPSDITYLTDIKLLNETREILEEVIDELYEQVKEKYKAKPRTYRKEARENYLVLAKQRKKSYKKIRIVIKKQLQYVDRDFGHISDLIQKGAKTAKLTRHMKENLKTCRKIYLQQKKMYDSNSHSTEDRIVSVSQPYVRPIVRGKAGKDVEFGPKIAISLINGYAFIDRLSFNSFNEGILLKEAVKNFYNRTGYYPEAILADHIYRNRVNRNFCKKNGIRLSGPKLGRRIVRESAAELKQAYKDACDRNAVESIFGVCKRKYGLNRIMAHLDSTTECLVAMNFFVYNMEKKLRLLFALFFRSLILLKDYHRIVCIF